MSTTSDPAAAEMKLRMRLRPATRAGSAWRATSSVSAASNGRKGSSGLVRTRSVKVSKRFYYPSRSGGGIDGDLAGLGWRILLDNSRLSANLTFSRRNGSGGGGPLSEQLDGGCVRSNYFSLSVPFACLMSLLASGCSLSTDSAPTADAGLAIRGKVFGGQQPLVGARVYLLAAN